MKKLHPLLSVLFLISIGFGQKEYELNQLVEQGGVHKKKFSDEIVNGKVFQMFDNKKIPLGKMIDGKKDGRWMVWNDNGTKKSEINYNNGLKNGLETYWYDNGQKKSEVTNKDGKKEGLWTIWYKNGQKSIESNCKDGKDNGLTTRWWDNGQKESEVTYKDGEFVEVIGKWFPDGSSRIIK